MGLGIIEFSKRIGVSTATVSRAFSGRGRISEKTQKRVLLEARRLGFTPNVHASRLNSKRTGQIGLCYGLSDDTIFDYYNMELAQEIAKVAESKNLTVNLELSSRGAKGNERLGRLSRGAGLDGIILVVEGRANGVGLLQSIEGCPVVVVTNRSWKRIGEETVIELDLMSGIAEAVRDLVAKGHERIGFIGGVEITGKRKKFQRVLLENSLEVDDRWIVEDAVSFSDGQKALGKIAGQGPTAVFCTTDVLAMGALNEAHLRGMAVPGDLSIVGMDNLAFTAYTTPSLSTIGIPRERIAVAAVESLEAKFKGEGSPPTGFAARQVIGSYYVPRASVGSLR
tara:strand:+ start:8128 stop:9144 length:1017 start_codon:yes stop_codon:yes gene_type:complete